MNKKLIGFVICLLAIGTALPVSGIYDSEETKIDLIQNVKYHSATVILFGIIKDMQSGNITTFTEVRVLNIIIHNFNGTKIPWIGISRNAKTDLDKRIHQFRGILLKHFICGVVKYPKVTASPSSIKLGLPAELEILVTSNDEGLNNVLVNISIPGIVEEMTSYTDSNGNTIFSFTPPSTGEIEIKIENMRIQLTVEIIAYDNNLRG